MSSYELIDSGDYSRLERFGSIVINRPAPQAEWSRRLDGTVWQKADLDFNRDESNLKNSQWIKSREIDDVWQIKIDNITVELFLSPNGQIGIFPEQLANWRWIQNKIKNSNRPLNLLNGFAYTGLATLFAATASDTIQVCHVDGAASTIKRAKKNAELNHVRNTAIRWIADDVNTFLKREIKRGQRYDAFILDPPAFGRGKGFTWKFERDFPVLLDCVEKLLSENPLFVLISCHVPNLTASELLAQCEMGRVGRPIQTLSAMDLIIPSSQGNPLPSGICARFEFS